MARITILLDKSIAACISAIEIYNKPDFKYREETFTILMINAWELLLKTKILKDNKSNIHSILVKTPKTLSNGTKSKKQTVVKTTRSGNPMSIELLHALDKLAFNNTNKITQPFKENIIALCEIRDNAIHFINAEPELSKTILELGTASLKNYLNAVKNWFNKDLSRYNFYLMPISFFHEFESVESFSTSRERNYVDNLLNYIGKKATEIKSNPEQDYNLLLKIETRFVKSSVEDALIVKTVRSRDEAEFPNQVQEVILTEEDIRKRYPWDYKQLCSRLNKRYNNFKRGNAFNILMNDLKKQNAICHVRLLNPSNAKTAKTYWYSPNCLNLFFDKHYSLNDKKGYA
jgi:hypothetical protein